MWEILQKIVMFQSMPFHSFACDFGLYIVVSDLFQSNNKKHICIGGDVNPFHLDITLLKVY